MPLGHLVALACGLLAGTLGQQPQQLGAQPLGVRRRGHPELAAEHLTAVAVLLERGTDPILIHVEPHEGAVHELLQRIEAQQPQGHLDSALDGTSDRIVVEQAAQDVVPQFLQPAALGREPSVELLAALGQARHQLATVKGRGQLQSFGRPVRGQPLEAHDIDLDGVGPDRCVARIDDKEIATIVGQRSAQPRQRLAQVGSRPVVGPVAPQEAGQPLPRLRPPRLHREVGEQGTRPPRRQPDGVAAGGAAFEPAEQGEVQSCHRREPPARNLIRGVV